MGSMGMPPTLLLVQRALHSGNIPALGESLSAITTEP